MGVSNILSDGSVNLILKLPPSLRERLYKLSIEDVLLPGKVEFVVLFGEDEAIVRESTESFGGSFENLGFGYGIVYLPISQIDSILKIRGIDYVELPKVLYTSYAVSNRVSCVNEAWNAYNLSGEGVLVGFIDSGIDYTHPAFKDDDGKTRIEYIYDLSQGGKIWNKNQIQQAIDSTDPFSIVDEVDDNGHGTHVASIACGGGKISQVYYGPAYKSSIAMVKITPKGSLNMGTSTLIMRGIKFLIDKSKELNKPLVINLSLSTNSGAHNGKSLFEKYISTVSALEPIVFVAASGNDGDTSQHVGGILKKTQDIALTIARDESNITIPLYKGLLSNISIEIINPASQSSGVIDIREEFFDRQVGRDRVLIYYTGPKPFDIDGEIIISLLSPENQFLLSGVWTIRIKLLNETTSIYNMWMAVTSSLNKETKFLNPDIYNTLGIPATVENVISVGSYNPFTGNISSFSGRGSINNPVLKPDIVAPGENIEAAIPRNRYGTKSGTSMATPEVSGICALLLEWGIVKGNDVILYGERLKYYLVKGAKRERTDVVYPDTVWGYGEVCLNNALNLLRLNRIN
ncbi:Subtilase family protein [Clostridium cadaveris]|uniref:Peptidase S8 n=1 Tax=Clostridium cadaveris TaxID=1529 RepID=A0A1I2LSU8_9CLOT|nr:S8 family peptidase [Clostridium cadaveris]PWL52265.1 MAG: peptidase S8 [Clostridium cadaveris]SFF81530.1 Subtilase family protein [Clostridium cadaveris]